MALAALVCVVPGLLLTVRRKVMLGDAMGHVLLPGILVGALLTGDADSPWLKVAACGSCLVAVGLIEWLTRGPLREDAAIGLAFPALFAVGGVVGDRLLPRHAPRRGPRVNRLAGVGDIRPMEVARPRRRLVFDASDGVIAGRERRRVRGGLSGVAGHVVRPRIRRERRIPRAGVVDRLISPHGDRRCRRVRGGRARCYSSASWRSRLRSDGFCRGGLSGAVVASACYGVIAAWVGTEAATQLDATSAGVTAVVMLAGLILVAAVRGRG